MAEAQNLNFGSAFRGRKEGRIIIPLYHQFTLTNICYTLPLRTAAVNSTAALLLTLLHRRQIKYCAALQHLRARVALHSPLGCCFHSSSKLRTTGLTRSASSKPRTHSASPFSPTRRATTQATPPRYHGLHRRQRPAYASSRRRCPGTCRRPSRKQAKARTQRTLLHRPCRAPVANSKRHSGHCQRVRAGKEPTSTAHTDTPTDTTPSHPSSSTHLATLT